MKFGMMTHIGPYSKKVIKILIFEIQDGGSRHVQKITKIAIYAQRFD